jgi:hypothetical protein
MKYMHFSSGYLNPAQLKGLTAHLEGQRRAEYQAEGGQSIKSGALHQLASSIME